MKLETQSHLSLLSTKQDFPQTTKNVKKRLSLLQFELENSDSPLKKIKLKQQISLQKSLSPRKKKPDLQYFEQNLTLDQLNYLKQRQKYSLSLVSKNPRLATQIIKENNQDFTRRAISIQQNFKLPDINMKVSEDSVSNHININLGKYDQDIQQIISEDNNLEFVDDESSPAISYRKPNVGPPVDRLHTRPQADEDRYRTQELRMARIIDENRKAELNKKIQDRMRSLLEKNEVCVFPSVKLKAFDQLPKFEIFDGFSRQVNANLQNNNSQQQMIKKRNVDYGIELHQQIIEYLKSKKTNKLALIESDSIKEKRAKGNEAIKAMFADKEEKGETEGLDAGAAPEEAKIIAKKVMRTIIRNSIMERDEEKVKNKVEVKLQLRKQMDSLKSQILELTQGESKPVNSNILKPHLQLSSQISQKFDDKKLQELYKELNKLQKQHQTIMKKEKKNNEMILSHKYSILKDTNMANFNQYFKDYYAQPKKLTKDQLEINELILNANKSNIKREFMSPDPPKKLPFGVIQEEEEEQPKYVIPTSFQKGSPDLINQNRFNLKPQNHQKVQDGYQKTLQKLEKDIFEDNKNFVILREIMSMVDPSDIIKKQPTEHIKNYQLRKLRQKGKSLDTLDPEELQQYQETLQKVGDAKFYDADTLNETVFKMKGRRAYNKERTQKVLENYQKYKIDQKLAKKRNKIIKKLGMDPKDPQCDEVIESIQVENTEISEQSDEEEEGSNSDVEVTSDMDIFDIIKLAEAKEGK